MPLEGLFKFEDDPLKHYVRVKGWLPLCRERQGLLQARKAKHRRRLKYFTFCAVNAVDVLMLEVAKVLHLSSSERFDTVYFFDRTADKVAQTQARIPGARGFAGNFVDTVLAPDSQLTPLDAPEDRPDTVETRNEQTSAAQKLELIQSFPFDVLNLDLEEFIFKGNDEFPSRLVNALRRVFEWQRQTVKESPVSEERLEGFTLFFTTRVGPPQLRVDYAQMLIDVLDENIARDQSLAAELQNRLGAANVAQLKNTNLSAFFELSIPKLLARLLMEADWYVSPEPGIITFRFTRSADPDYDMLHFGMQVVRQNPSVEHRVPGTVPTHVTAAYDSVARQVFVEPALVVNQALAAEAQLRPSLEEIKARRRKHYPDEMG